MHFCDILKANSEDLLYLDTFAVRNLVLTAPRSMRVLSAMQVRQFSTARVQCVFEHHDGSSRLT